MDSKKISKISQKITETEEMMGLLSSGEGIRVEMSGSGPSHYVFLSVNGDNQADYKLSESMLSALREYYESLKRDLIAELRRIK